MANSPTVALTRAKELLTALAQAYRAAREANAIADEGEDPFAVPLEATVGVPGREQDHELQRLRDNLQVPEVQSIEHQLHELGVLLRFEDDPYGSGRARLWLSGQ